MVAWMIDHDASSMALITRVFDSQVEGLTKLIFYKQHDKGGHFAAWEQPELLTSDLRAAFKSLR
jgi:hypothetical protein